jgi:glutathione-regulated potassium-efflux system ancillary protein KefC
LAKSLLGFKELFLVGFFLSIGLSAPPTWQALALAILLALLIPFKAALFFWLLCRFRLRVRSSLFASLSLANYSEFGLIVGAVAVANGWLSSEWLIVLALTVSLTFVLAAPLNAKANAMHRRMHGWLGRFEVSGPHPDDLLQSLSANVAIIGMGRIGGGAYDLMRKRCGANVMGIDFSDEVVAGNQRAGRNVILGDATDPEFWEMVKAKGNFERLEMVMLAMPKHRANMFAVEQLKRANFAGTIAAIAMFEDQLLELRQAGVHAAYNFYAEAGAGFAEHVYEAAAQSGVLPRVCELGQS